jgi:serine protease Do
VRFREGVLVLEVEAGSPARQAGFQPGDIIAKINDQEVNNLADYRKVLKPLKNKKRAVLFLIYRDGEPLFVAVKP